MHVMCMHVHSSLTEVRVQADSGHVCPFAVVRMGCLLRARFSRAPWGMAFGGAFRGVRAC